MTHGSEARSTGSSTLRAPIARGAWLAVLGLALACDGAPTPSEGEASAALPAVDTSPPAEADEAAADELDDQLEQLRALGYVDFSEELADPNESGARTVLPERVQPGLRLYTAAMKCAARLIDVEGEVVREWRDPSCKKWMQAEILSNGDLLTPGVDAPRDGKPRPSKEERQARKAKKKAKLAAREAAGERPSERRIKPVRANDDGGDDSRRFLSRMSWDGELLWKLPIPAHHDAEEIAGGDILALTRHERDDHDLEENTVLVDHAVTRLSADGEVKDLLSFWDVTRHNDIGFELLPVTPRKRDRRIDLFHSNSVEAMTRPDLAEQDPLYSLDNVLISVRHQDTLLMIDRVKKKLVWAWGQGIISGPHDARMMDNGNILVFDNGLSREWSRVLEVNPLTREIVWSFGDDGEHRFFTAGRGSSQLLPNGNALIANSNSGEAFEVTRDGQSVWRFFNPDLNEDGYREIIVRMIHYPREGLARFLDPPPAPPGSP